MSTFCQTSAPSPPGLMKQHAKNEILKAGPQLRITNFIKLFLAIAAILYPLKTPKVFLFPGVFRGHKMGALTRNGSM